MHDSARCSVRTRWLQADDRSLLAQCDLHAYRASGPGGQKRNKTDSAVRLRHRPTGVTVVATESRSQHENRARALRRLRLAIALSIREPAEATVLADAANVIDFDPKRMLRIGPRSAEYPVLIAHVLDVLEECRGSISDAAGRLGTTTAQLARYLTTDGRIMAAANRLRDRHGHRPLRR